MIGFLCPRCSKQYSVGDDKAGKQTTCPACKQLMTIPTPQATPVQHSAPVPVTPMATPQANPFAMSGEPESNLESSSYQPRRRSSSSALPWVLVGLLLLVCASGGAVWWYTSGKSIPLLNDNHETWTHKELIAHLKGEGLQFEAEETRRGAFFGPAMLLTFEGDDAPIYVQIRKSPQEARDEASPKGDEAFAWGRFYFAGTPKRLKQIRASLP